MRCIKYMQSFPLFACYADLFEKIGQTFDDARIDTKNEDSDVR
jgi:hypothetical protein